MVSEKLRININSIQIYNNAKQKADDPRLASESRPPLNIELRKD